jgi:hypothetical protein
VASTLLSNLKKYIERQDGITWKQQEGLQDLPDKGFEWGGDTGNCNLANIINILSLQKTDSSPVVALEEVGSSEALFVIRGLVVQIRPVLTSNIRIIII